MSTILYWNIQDFAINKIQDQGKKRNKYGQKRNLDRASSLRFDFILNHIEDLDPDIFVVVEVEAPQRRARGQLISGGSGSLGIFALLESMQNIDANWGLVPPLRTGNHEAVGVFFRQDRMICTGPNFWMGGQGPTTNAITYALSGAYPPAVQTMNNTLIPPGAWNANGFAMQARCAGRVNFTDGVGAAVDFGTLRAPFQTTFWDIANGRNINIFSVHSPPSPADAANYLNTLATIPAITGAPVATEYRIVLGDFNLNLLSPTALYTNCYNALCAAVLANPFAIALIPNPLAPAPAPLIGYRAYFSTHILPINATKDSEYGDVIRPGATFWSTAARNAYYPGYSYISVSYNNAGNVIYPSDSLDNILYKFYAGTNVVNPPQTTVINGIVGSPYRPVGANPGALNLGYQAFASELGTAWAVMDNPPPPTPAPPDVGELADIDNFFPLRNAFTRNLTNYPTVRGTSDHLPLFFSF